MSDVLVQMQKHVNDRNEGILDLQVAVYDCNAFEKMAEKKDYTYQKGTLKKINKNTNYKKRTSFFNACIERYNYALQKAFIDEMAFVIYEVSQQHMVICGGFNLPHKIGHTLDAPTRYRREKKLIKEVFELKLFNQWYSKQYEDGECIEIILEKVKSIYSLNEEIYLKIKTNYESEINRYIYNQDITKDFNMAALEEEGLPSIRHF